VHCCFFEEEGGKHSIKQRISDSNGCDFNKSVKLKVTTLTTRSILFDNSYFFYSLHVNKILFIFFNSIENKNKFIFVFFFKLKLGRRVIPLIFIFYQKNFVFHLY
jgi:hypothetical protein